MCLENTFIMKSIKLSFLVLLLFIASSFERIYSKSFSGYIPHNEQFIIIDIEFGGKDGLEVNGVIRDYEEINDAQKDYASNYLYARDSKLREGFNEAESPFRGETPTEEIKFSGKIISGDQNKGKIEVKLGGKAPWWELQNKSDKFWKIIPDQYGGGLEVPMVLSKSYNNKALTFLCLDRGQQQPASTSPEEKAAPNSPDTENKNSSLIVGIWLPHEGEVARTYNLDHTYFCEMEGAVYDEGKWLFEGDNLITIDESGTKRVTRIKFISKDVHEHIPQSGKPFRWDRLKN